MRNQSNPRGPYRKRPIAERFWEKVRKSDGCWTWLGACNRTGYGMIGRDYTNALAHRVSWELHYGAIGDLCVLHKCDNPPCVNPHHLFLGTRADNTADMIAKGRRRQGVVYPGPANSSAKFTMAQVREIRALYQPDVLGRGCTTLARQFGVSEVCITRIVKNITYAE